jgi:LacI family transcriptional regulator
VLVNRTDGRGELPAVISDDMLGMRLAVDHLVALGHRRIVHLAGPGSFSTGLSRRIGFEQALRAQALEPVAVLECAAYAVEAGHAAMLELLAKKRGKRAFSAVVAANDLIALGALQALRERAVPVPAEVSVIGHNDMPLLAQVNPPLSSVRIQHYEMGFRAARLLLEQLCGTPGSVDATVVLRPTLVLRASTAAPAQP